MAYAAKHAQALRKVRAAGKAVLFRYETDGTYDAATDTHSEPTVESTVGYAVELPDEVYEDQLMDDTMITLFFVPKFLGDLPEVRSQVEWAGVVRTVHRLRPIRPDGYAIAAKVMVS